MHRDRAGLLVLDAHRRGDRNDLVGEEARSLRGGGALLRLERIFVAPLARHAVAIADDFGGVDHRHVDAVVHREQLGVGADAHLARLDEADALDTASDAHVHAVDNDLLGGGSDGHQARGTLAIEGHAGDPDAEPGAEGSGAADRCLDPLRQRTADDAILDVGGGDPGALDGGADGVGGQRRRRGRVERPAIGAADRGAGGGNDDGVASGHFSLLESLLVRRTACRATGRSARAWARPRSRP